MIAVNFYTGKNISIFSNVIKQQNRNNNWRAETNRRNAQPYNNRRNTFNRGRSQDNKTPERPKPAESRPKTEEKPKAVEKEATNDTTAETIDLSVDEGR